MDSLISDTTETQQIQKVHFTHWLKVMGLHVLFSTFLTIMNFFAAMTATSATIELGKVSSDINITNAHKNLGRVGVWLWVWFALMFIGAFCLVIITPFFPFVLKYGEYLLLLVEISQTFLFLYATIASFSALATIKASQSYQNGDSNAKKAATSVRNLGIMSLVTFFSAIGYLVYIFMDIFKSGGFRKRLASHSTAVQSVGISFSAPDIVFGSGIKKQTGSATRPLVANPAVNHETLSGEI